MTKHKLLQTNFGFDFELTAVQKIKDNPYCAIYQANSCGEKLVVKQYKNNREDLFQQEIAGIEYYHKIVGDNTSWLDCKVVAVARAQLTFAMSFVPGQRLTDVIYQSPDCAYDVLQSLGQLLRTLHCASTQQTVGVRPFFADYLHYTSKRLDVLPWILRRFTKNFTKPDHLIQSVANCPHQVGFVHGDFVPRNIHVYQNRVGLVDFANCHMDSSIVNDLYNLHLALAEMRVNSRFRQKLWQAFCKGLGEFSVEQPIAEFFWAYQSRRWLMLKAISHNPIRWLQFIIGVASFANPTAMPKLQ